MEYLLALMLWLAGLGPNPDAPIPPDNGGVTTHGGGIPTKPPEQNGGGS